MTLLLTMVAVAVAFSIFIYRHTNPIVPTFVRALLTALRTAALVLLLFVIFEATLSLHFERENPPILAIAVDNSASMNITDDAGSRPDVIQDLMSDSLINLLDRQFDVKYYGLSNTIESISPRDSLQFLGDATNIREGLEKIKAENAVDNLSSILLISDGSYNDGGNPVRYAEELAVPVFTIGVGSSDSVTDLALVDINANPFTYAGQTTPIEITVRNTGFGRLAPTVELQQEGQTLERQTIDLPPSPSEKTVTINFTPTTVGRQKLTVIIPQHPGERLTENNARSFYMDVFKSKLKILLMAGSVSPDISFMKKNLQNDRYEVQSLVYKGNGQFYQQLPSIEALGDIDIFIFLDFPASGINQAFLQNVRSTIDSKKRPVLLVSGARTSLSDLALFSEFIPLKNATVLQNSQQISVEVSPLGTSHPIMQVSSDPTMVRTIWRQLPPVYMPFIVRQLAPGSEVLAYARTEQQSNRISPLIAIRTNGAQKSAAIFAEQLWRWDFMMRGINRTEDVYNQLLQNMLRWLETNRSESLVRVTMDNTQYHYGDPINIKIDAFDENLESVDNAQVHVTLRRQGDVQDFTTQPKGQGTYTASLRAPQPGDYTAIVRAERDGQLLGEEEIRFSVGEYSAELADIQAQPAVLQNLSRVTGGQYASADSAAALFQSLHGEPTMSITSSENELWNNKLILVLLLLLLTVEWFVRKRRGMV